MWQCLCGLRNYDDDIKTMLSRATRVAMDASDEGRVIREAYNADNCRLQYHAELSTVVRKSKNRYGHCTVVRSYPLVPAPGRTTRPR